MKIITQLLLFIRLENKLINFSLLNHGSQYFPWKSIFFMFEIKRWKIGFLGIIQNHVSVLKRPVTMGTMPSPSVDSQLVQKKKTKIIMIKLTRNKKEITKVKTFKTKGQFQGLDITFWNSSPYPSPTSNGA